MAQFVPCTYCGKPIELPSGYGAVHASRIHPECKTAKAAEEATAQALYDEEDEDALIAEFVADYEANRDQIKKGKEAARARMKARAQEVERHQQALAATHEEVVKFREAMAMIDAEKQLDEPAVPGGHVTRRDLIRYAKETEDLAAWAKANTTFTRPWWAKLFNLRP